MEQFGNENRWLSIVETAIYNCFVELYYTGIALVAWFNPKAKHFVNGRKSIFLQLQDLKTNTENRYWFHCASLGEFEQARPLIEAIKKQDEKVFIAVSFFSPSGYEIRKNHPLADVVFYLPKDTKANAKKLLYLLRPTQVFWVKYEFWYHILKALKTQQIPTYLVCANFREGQIFFKRYGAFFRKQLSFFTKIFVQNKASEKLLKTIGVPSIVAGDTRFDRVCEIASQAKSIPEIENFAQGKKLLIAGSTWNADIELLSDALPDDFFSDYKLVIAPHNVNEEAIKFIESKGKVAQKNIVRYSSLKENTTSVNAPVLILDTTGLLASAYRYGTLAYIGGGFGASVHNVLEAAVYGLPTIFGTNYKKSREAIELIELNAAKSVKNVEELKHILQLFKNQEFLKKSSETGRNYVVENSGATQRIIDALAEK